MLHLEPGAAAATHYFQGQLTYTFDYIPGISEPIAFGYIITRFGNEYPLSGFSQGHYAQWYAFGGYSNEYVRLEFPALGINEVVATTGGASGSTALSRVELVNAEMTASLCGAWTVEFTNLKWYVGGVLVYEHGAGTYSVSGIDYRQAKNQTRILAGRSFKPDYEYGGINCNFVSVADIHDENTASMFGGWAYDVAGTPTAEPITIDSLALPAVSYPGSCPGACTCSTTLPSVSETDSYNVTVEAEGYFLLDATYVGMTTCPCPGRVFFSTVNLWDFDKEFYEKSSWVDAISENDTSLHTSRRTRAAGCSCTYPLIDGSMTIVETVTTDAIAYAAHWRGVSRSVADARCAYGVIVCPAGPDGVSPPPLCLLPTPTLCYYNGYVTQEPVEPCSCTDAAPSVTVTDEGIWVAAKECDSDLYTGLADQTKGSGSPPSFTWTSAGFTGSSPSIAVWGASGAQEWWLVYVSGGTVYSRISKDKGATWSVATSVDTGASPRNHIVRGDGRRFVYWVSGTSIEGAGYDAAMNQVIAPFTISGITIDASSVFDITSFSGGHCQWTAMITYISGGTVTVKTSLDGVNWS